MILDSGETVRTITTYSCNDVAFWIYPRGHHSDATFHTIFEPDVVPLLAKADLTQKYGEQLERAWDLWGIPKKLQRQWAQDITKEFAKAGLCSQG